MVKVKMEPNTWKQIGGDADYTERLILGHYDPSINEIHVIQIDSTGEGGYSLQEGEYDITEMQKEYSITQFGLKKKDLKEKGLELLAESILTNQGGDPVNCLGQAEYASEVPDFDSALACAIGGNEFIAWDGSRVKANQEEVKPYDPKWNPI
jgi:hypothetical protein